MTLFVLSLCQTVLLLLNSHKFLIRETPRQLLSESVCSYFYKYVNSIVLHAFIEDNPNNLDTTGEMDKFLAALTHFAVLTSICRLERGSRDPMLERKYTQGQIE